MARLPEEPRSSEITPEALYLRRREFIRNAALYIATSTAIGAGLVGLTRGAPLDPPRQRRAAGRPPSSAPARGGVEAGSAPLTIASRGRYTVPEAKNSYEQITTYNNFYEFGLDKSDPAAHAHTLRTRPWTASVEGEVCKPVTLDID